MSFPKRNSVNFGIPKEHCSVTYKNCDYFVFRLKSAELGFLEEYSITMKHVAQALNILQSENKAHLGYLLPTLSALLEKQQNRQEKATSCIPLIDALLAGICKRFCSTFGDKQAIAAAILHPTFGISLISHTLTHCLQETDQLCHGHQP